MKVKQIQIKNFKSLVNVQMTNPNPFTVFVGPNGAGKSNIFEALEFYSSLYKSSQIPEEAINRFGTFRDLVSYKSPNKTPLVIRFYFNDFDLGATLTPDIEKNSFLADLDDTGKNYELSVKNMSRVAKEGGFSLTQNIEHKIFLKNHSRIFIGNEDLVKQKINSDSALSLDCSNLEKVLKRILSDENKKGEIIEWLQLLIPGFENIEVITQTLSGSDDLLIYENGSTKPFPKRLISDGTFNIVSILTAVFQNDEPQFLCIEEPENGLNPKVAKELVNLFRSQCEQKGHFIWLNTHSQSLVSQLRPEEVILVDKINGETQIKQVRDINLHGLSMDEAWLTNSLGGGIPW
jgi:predicted ATPase